MHLFCRIERQNSLSISKKFNQLSFSEDNVLLVRFECYLSGEVVIDLMTEYKNNFIKSIRKRLRPYFVFWRLMHTVSGGFRCEFLLILSGSISYERLKSVVVSEWTSEESTDKRRFVIFSDKLCKDMPYRFCSSEVYNVKSSKFKDAFSKAKHYFIGPSIIQGLCFNKKIKSFGAGVIKNKR